MLVVEDDDDLRHTIEMALRLQGYGVATAADAMAALALAETVERLDVVLTDVVLLGGAPGPELVTALRAHHPAVSVVFMSGHSGGSLHRLGVEPDAVVLHKPFRVEELRHALETATARSGR